MEKEVKIDVIITVCKEKAFPAPKFKKTFLTWAEFSV